MYGVGGGGGGGGGGREGRGGVEVGGGLGGERSPHLVGLQTSYN